MNVCHVQRLSQNLINDLCRCSLIELVISFRTN